MMAQMIRKDGLADEYMASMMKMVTGNGVGIDKILAMLTSLGVPRSQTARVARSQGLMDGSGGAAHPRRGEVRAEGSRGQRGMRG